MPSTSAPLAVPDHQRLAPPRDGQWLGPVGMALTVHGALLLALSWGVSWKRDDDRPPLEAEIWSSVPVQAAPRATDLPPPQPPKPLATPANSPPRPEAPRATQPPARATPTEADIATRQARQQQAAERRAADQKAQQAARDQAQADKAAAQKRAADQKRAAQQAADQRAAEKKAADQKAAAERQAQETADALAREQQRQANLRRMLSQAGASGGPQASGTALQSSGPTPGYGGRVAARIKPNVVFTDAISGNPRAEVEVRTQPDGTIVGRRLVKSSGHAAWDEAVLKAIDRTGTLPRDTDGRVPPVLIVGLRPLD